MSWLRGVQIDGDDVTWDDLANNPAPQAGLTAQHSSRVVEITAGPDETADGSHDNSPPVRQRDWTGGKHQQWRPEPVGDGYYRLIARHSGRVLQIGHRQRRQPRRSPRTPTGVNQHQPPEVPPRPPDLTTPSPGPAVKVHAPGTTPDRRSTPLPALTLTSTDRFGLQRTR
ncbi:RICIN domain-containing protein [Kitasatospora purpeofusca]|uniref:RICIN domain-containing protein n=1 Tax=Kitasatospora purpeofusca TaxID=67352 RepID=UPI00386B4881